MHDETKKDHSDMDYLDLSTLHGGVVEATDQNESRGVGEFKLVSRGQGTFKDRYRPQRFSEVVPTCSLDLIKGQIDNPNASQIFLFSGPTGVGKTTCAKIMAKAVNCTAENTEPKPCLKCQNCDSYKKSYDKIEMNVADKNKIEDIRGLVEDMRYAPAVFKKKVYILDEVQRLSGAAQQVLLTELEEPPPYLFVILCTTDESAINPALVDRTCRIRFKELDADNAGEVITQVDELEQINLTSENRLQVFEGCRGSVRRLLNNLELLSSSKLKEDASKDNKSTEIDLNVPELVRVIRIGDWKQARKLISVVAARNEPERARIAIEGYFRGILLNTTDQIDGSKVAEAMGKVTGTLIHEPEPSQFNQLVLKVYTACKVFFGS